MTNETEKKPVEGNAGVEPKGNEDVDAIIARRTRGLSKEIEKRDAELSALKAQIESEAKQRAENDAKAKGEWEKVAEMAKQEAAAAKAAAKALEDDYARKGRIMDAKAKGVDDFTARGLELAWRETPEAERPEFSAFLATSLESLKANAPRSIAPMVGSPAHGNKGLTDEALLMRPLNDPEGDAARARLFAKITGTAQ